MIRYNSFRQIKFGGKWSLDDFGVLIGQESDTNTRIEYAKPRVLRETVPFRDGSYDYSRMSGKLVYDDRTLRYTFIISGHTRADVEDKVRQLDNWLGDSNDTELYDTDFPLWKFTGVSYLGIGELTYYSSNENRAQVTAEFTASPYLRSRSGQETTCCDITPNASPAYYLFNEYTSGGVEYYYLSRMKRANSSAPLSSTITYDEVTLPGPKLGAYPHITIAAATAPAYYMMPPKSTNGTSIYADESTLIGGSIVSGGIEGYTYLKQNAYEALSFRIFGYDPTTLGNSTSRSNCTMHIKEAAWYYPADSGTVRFRKDLIPNTDRMQILSEAEPVVRLNPPYYGTADPVDIKNFALKLYDLLRIENAENELCRLRYNSVTYRR